MSVTHSTAVRNALANLVVDALDSGFIEFQTSGGTEVATCAFGSTAFGAASSGVATANTISDDSDATGGTITKFELQQSDTTADVFGSVTATGMGGDIEISSATITAGETVSVTSLTYEAAD